MIFFINDNYVNDEKATLSPFDRGFIFSDGIYEVIRFYDGKLFLLNEHMQRLSGNLRETEIRYEDFEKLPLIIKELISKNDLQKKDGIVYLQITRGVQQPRNRIYLNQNFPPTIFISVSEYPVIKDPPGVSIMTQKDFRWARCDIKSTMLLSSVMASNNAAASGFDEVLWHDDKHVFEGSHTNIFFVKNDKIFTPVLNKKILPGVTRMMVIKILAKEGLEFSEREVLLDEALHSDECFITGTTTEITPVYKINNKIIGEGKTGVITNLIRERFNSECTNPENLTL